MKIKYDPKNKVVAIVIKGTFFVYMVDGGIEIHPLESCEKPEIIEEQLVKPVDDEAL